MDRLTKNKELTDRDFCFCCQRRIQGCQPATALSPPPLRGQEQRPKTLAPRTWGISPLAGGGLGRAPILGLLGPRRKEGPTVGGPDLTMASPSPLSPGSAQCGPTGGGLLQGLTDLQMCLWPWIASFIPLRVRQLFRAVSRMRFWVSSREACHSKGRHHCVPEASIFPYFMSFFPPNSPKKAALGLSQEAQELIDRSEPRSKSAQAQLSPLCQASEKQYAGPWSVSQDGVDPRIPVQGDASSGHMLSCLAGQNPARA